jgi:hypothetical protein
LERSYSSWPFIRRRKTVCRTSSASAALPEEALQFPDGLAIDPIFIHDDRFVVD